MNRVPLRRDRTGASALATLLLLGAAASAQPRGPALVEVATIEERDVAPTQEFVGLVTPARRVTVGSAVDGRVVEFPVEEGDRVEAGQTLARLLTETIGLELAAAEGELELRQQRLTELRNGTRPEEIAQAKARHAAAEARLRYAQARRERAVGAFRTGRAISEDERDEAVAVAAEAEQVALEMQAALDLAIAGPRTEAIAQAEAEVAIQRAVVQRLEDQLAKHTIVTRFAGYVVAEHTEEGDWLNRGDPVADVVALDEVEVVAQVTEEAVRFVRPGVTTEVAFEAAPDRAKPGRVVAVVPDGDARARTFRVRLLVENELMNGAPLLLPGMLARVALPVGPDRRALLAPKDAVVLGGPTPVVFVVDASGDAATVRPVPVQLGVASGERIQVTGEIAGGERVVVEGNERLRPGQAVRVGVGGSQGVAAPGGRP